MTLQNAHALVIGISRYQRASELWSNEDAQDISAVLQDPDYCGYPSANVYRLRDEAATRDAIFAALDALARDTTADSTVFIYYSGHGASAKHSPAYYVIPVDGATSSDDELEGTAISNAALSAHLGAIPAQRLTLVLDCCRAADLAEPRLARAAATLAQGRGRVVLAASRATGGAFTAPGKRNSRLTGHLLDGLRGAAGGVSGVIRVCDLFHYVQACVARETSDQHPVFKAELEENYPIAQVRRGTHEPLAIPPPPDKLAYDAFISYCRDDDSDRAWVLDTLVPVLEGLGLRLCLDHRDFRLGASRIAEIEGAVTNSRYTVGVFTPAYLAGAFEMYHSLLAAHVSVETRLPRFVPLIRRPCSLVLHARMADALDVSRDVEVFPALEHLANRLRQAPRPRLDPWPGAPSVQAPDSAASPSPHAP